MNFYRFPCGMFESLGGPWQVLLYRPMPSTPAGDLVGSVPDKEEADRLVAELNAKGADLASARRLFAGL